MINLHRLFDHLIEHGAYSEADASRLLRQVASALDFIHGIGVVHADMKVRFLEIMSHVTHVKSSKSARTHQFFMLFFINSLFR
jgi:serine/threonine protein kinase